MILFLFMYILKLGRRCGKSGKTLN